MDRNVIVLTFYNSKLLLITVKVWCDTEFSISDLTCAGKKVAARNPFLFETILCGVNHHEDLTAGSS